MDVKQRILGRTRDFGFEDPDPSLLKTMVTEHMFQS
jgi:hypothetical protein